MSCLLVKCHGNRTDRISQNCRLGSSTLIFKFFSDAAVGKSFILKWSKRRAQKIIHFIVSSCMQCSNLLHAKATSNSKTNKWGNQKNYKPIMHFLLEPCRKNTLILIMTEIPAVAVWTWPSCAVGGQGMVQPPPQPARDLPMGRWHFPAACPPFPPWHPTWRAVFVQRKVGGAGAGFRRICHVLTYFA